VYILKYRYNELTMTYISVEDYVFVIILERIFENNYHLHKDKLLGRSGGQKRRPKRCAYKSLLEHPVDDCQVFGLFALYIYMCVCVFARVLYIFMYRYNKSHQFYQWPLLAFAVLTTGKDERMKYL